MREPKDAWVASLRRLTGNETDDIRWNEAVGRWEFLLMSGDGISRSQFWGHFDIPVDPLSGLHPYRELDDDSMRDALHNLTKTFVGNPLDGHTSTQGSTATFKEVETRMRWNKAEGERRWKQGGDDFATMAAERGHRLRGALLTGAGGTVAQQARKIEIPSVIGGRV